MTGTIVPSTREELWGRLRAGDLRTVPILAGLLAMWLVFGLVNPAFWSAENLVNLSLQSAPTGIIALGVVLVLLVGQIDLSVGSVSGLAAAVLAVATVRLEWPFWLGLLLALTVGVIVGLGYGLAFSRLGLPSFVLTLAGLILLAGVQLRVLGPEGSVNLPFESVWVRVIQRGFVPDAIAWVGVGAIALSYVGICLRERGRRLRAELAHESVAAVVGRGLALALLCALVVGYLGSARGVGYAVVLFVGLVVVVDVMLRRTRWGRSVRAIGGDRRAALLAGVPVRRTMVSVFVACSTFAALGGLVAAGRLAATNQGTGGAETYLTAIAAAVIGGTSLFGGRGSAWSAVLGVLVLQSIANGLTLMNLDSATRYIVTGAVLLLALGVDTVVRGRRER